MERILPEVPSTKVMLVNPELVEEVRLVVEITWKSKKIALHNSEILLNSSNGCVFGAKKISSNSDIFGAIKNLVKLWHFFGENNLLKSVNDKVNHLCIEAIGSAYLHLS